MRGRDYKNFRENGYYHIFNRGDNKEPIFVDVQDYLNFLVRIKILMNLITLQQVGKENLRIQSMPKDSFHVLAYCLMPNHFHFLIQQLSNVAISKIVSKLSVSYAMYFNRKYARVGNLFQDTFKAKEVDNDTYLTYLSAYIHNNPSDPLTFPFSSFPDYLEIRPGEITHTKFILDYFNGDRERYKHFVLGYIQSDNDPIRDFLFED